jgi:hypothetical protein
MTTDLTHLFPPIEYRGPVRAVLSPEGLRMIDEAKNASPDPRDAEIARLRGLVEAAYEEGEANGVADSHGTAHEGWPVSNARKALGDAAISAEPGPERRKVGY